MVVWEVLRHRLRFHLLSSLPHLLLTCMNIGLGINIEQFLLAPVKNGHLESFGYVWNKMTQSTMNNIGMLIPPLKVFFFRGHTPK